ncbi:MAG: tetratricopeptide repeat protein [Spirochaetaceae bacterium]|nr:tetratricopeptide repeat protein [Spirochaetaceae bacterium]
MNRITRIVIIFFLSLQALHAQNSTAEENLNMGLNELRIGNTGSAAAAFREILNNNSMSDFFPDALYWLIKVDIILENYDEASVAADGFIINYGRHKYTEEIKYQRGRLLYLENAPDDAITALGLFIQDYPESEFLSSAYYWIGESLMALGRLEDADIVFSELLTEYPSSIKIEAARYRRSEISLLYRERELLDLLKWSHEEYLQDSEDFYRRESEYMKVIEDYRIQLAGNNQSDQNRTYSSRLLDVKERLLTIREYYIMELLRLYNEQ